MKKKVMKGMPYAGNPHVRVVEGKVESAAKPRRWSLLYKRWINRLWDEDDGQVIIGPPIEYVVLALLVAIVTVVTCLWGWKVSGWEGVCYGLLATPFIVVAIRDIVVAIRNIVKIVVKKVFKPLSESMNNDKVEA